MYRSTFRQRLYQTLPWIHPYLFRNISCDEKLLICNSKTQRETLKGFYRWFYLENSLISRHLKKINCENQRTTNVKLANDVTSREFEYQSLPFSGIQLFKFPWDSTISFADKGSILTSLQRGNLFQMQLLSWENFASTRTVQTWFVTADRHVLMFTFTSVSRTLRKTGKAFPRS